MVCDGVSSNFNEGNKWTRANYPDPLTVMALATPPPAPPPLSASGILIVAFVRVRDHLIYKVGNIESLLAREGVVIE